MANEYIKLFNTHNEYIAFTATTEFVKPNVSVCREEDEVHYNALASISNAIVTCDSATYNGNTQIATNIVVTLGGNTLIENTDYTITGNTGGINAGNYTFIVNGIGNYSGSKNGTFTINKAAGSVTTAPTAKNLTYNESAQALVNAGSGTGTMMYKLSSGSWGTSIPTASEVGTYAVYYKASASTNYNESASGSVSVTIDAYLTFVATESGTFKFSGNSINYSLDNGSTWTSLASDTNTPTISAGSKILWKATDLTPTSSIGIGRFGSTGAFNVEGNVMSLLYGDDFVGQTSLSGKDYAFKYLFSGCTGMTSEVNLSLPATTLADYCYDHMFYGCTNLITAPVLSATTLASGCYSNMFYNCKSLTTAPVLSATTLASCCYQSMFQGCSGLTTAPELPATTLADYCYYGMFSGCTSLTTAPELSATTLASCCYQSMFQGCSGLTTAPELPATRLASSCYNNMFQGCTSLTTAPVLSATTLVNYCYSNMFSGCTSLNYIKAMFTTTPRTSYMNNWVNNVASSGTFVMNDFAMWDTGTTACGTSTYPCNWTVETASS